MTAPSALRLARLALLAHQAPSLDALPPEFGADFATACAEFGAELDAWGRATPTSTLRDAAQDVVDAYHGCGDGAYDGRSLPEAVHRLRHALSESGAK